MDSSRCVVIGLKLSSAECLLKYLLPRKDDYNWILKESNEDPSKVQVCVWWRKDKEFFNTPLRSFLKRLKNKLVLGQQPNISGKMSTEKGVQMVCKKVPGSITKYHLELPLYPCLSGLLPSAPLQIGDCNEVGGSDESPCGKAILENILQKLNHLLEVVYDMSAEVRTLPKLNILLEAIGDMASQINALRESMTPTLHGDYSDYDPPRSYLDHIIGPTQKLVEPSLPCIPPNVQS